MRHVALCCGIVGGMVLAGGCSGGPHEAMRIAIRDYELASPALAAGPAATGQGRTDAVNDPGNRRPWTLALGDKAPETPDAPADGPGPLSWRKRKGQAYPGDFWRSFGRWGKELPATLWDDTVATATDPVALIGVGVAGAAGIVINASGADNRVSDHYVKHRPQLSHFGDMVGDVGGNPGTHFALAGSMLLYSMAAGDADTYEKSSTLINALAINGVATLAMKGLVRTRAPNGGAFGWPSGHTSSTFCLATVLHKQYGPLVGVPLFAFAAFVGYERIDARNHDFSDVVSGAIIGIVIGHAVSENHKARILGMDLIPYVNPRGGVGVALSRRW